MKKVKKLVLNYVRISYFHFFVITLQIIVVWSWNYDQHWPSPVVRKGSEGRTCIVGSSSFCLSETNSKLGEIMSECLIDWNQLSCDRREIR